MTAGGLDGLAESYDYDELGNRTASHISVGHLVNEANQLLSDNQFSYVYDLNGNLLSKTDTATSQTTTYNWNAQNQLVSIDFHDLTTAAYAYDALGRRIEKDVDGAVTAYVYDGEDIALEFDDLGALLARYSHGQSTDQPLAMERGGQTYYYHADQLGSVRLVTDSAGAVINRYDYDAYGNFEVINEGVTSPYTFTGREFDAESGLFYYRARYYDANSGRFISEDPLGFSAGDANLYRYVANNPVNLTDPSGEVAPLVVAAIVLNAAFGAADAISNGCTSLAGIVGGAIGGAINPFARIGKAAAILRALVLRQQELLQAGRALRAAREAARAGRRGGRSAPKLDGPRNPGSGAQSPQARGRESEQRVLNDLGLKKNNTKVSTNEGNSIPDALTPSRSVEVKDTKCVYCTEQIRVQTGAAKASGRTSTLVTGTNTRVSRTTERAFDEIIRRPDLGPR